MVVWLVNSPETGTGVAGFPTEGRQVVVVWLVNSPETGTGVAGFPTEGTGGILCEAGSGCVAG